MGGSLVRLAAIADDITGGTDLASVIRQAGFSVVQTIGVPATIPSDVDAVVVSLKIRSAPVADATAAASSAAAFLRGTGAAQIYFKYCSTFDSTASGNIGPIAERLLADFDSTFTVATPAYPEFQRTVYLGHLFVGRDPLAESSMRNHPLTPMRDSNLVRVLERQCRGPVGLVPLKTIDAGVLETRRAFENLKASGHQIAIIDAVLPRHLDTLAEATQNLPLTTGSAGLGARVARLNAARGPDPSSKAVPAVSREDAPVAILSGSCSAATQQQVARTAYSIPARAFGSPELADASYLGRLIEWAVDRVQRNSVMIYSTTAAQQIEDAQRVGASAATMVEAAFGRIARALADSGVRTFIVAGGETSGAVLESLGIRALAFGNEIDPGVPWAFSLDPPGYRFALKSGNFGSPDFFAKAIREAR